jgi:hypothetical protein
MIQVKTIDNRIERSILIGTIVSSAYLTSFCDLYTDPDYFRVPWSRTIAEWATLYFKKYRKAPGKDIQRIYEIRSKGSNSEDMENIGKFLQFISAEYERMNEINVPYLVDQTVQYFKERAIELLQDDLEAVIHKNDYEEAEKLILEFNKIEAVNFDVFDLHKDNGTLSDIFHRQKEGCLVEYPGRLGKLINPLLRRGCLTSILGGEKSGKSHFLDDIAFRALMNRKKVIVFDAGDMTPDQRKERIASRITMQVVNPFDAGEILVPVMDCEKNQTNFCQMKERSCRVGIKVDKQYLEKDEIPPDYVPCTFCSKERPHEYEPNAWYKYRNIEFMSEESLKEGWERFQTRIAGSQYKMICYPNSTLTVRRIEADLDRLEKTDDFVPDIVVVDYADLLVPENTRVDIRHQQDEIWRNLRRVSQDRHILLLTATQAPARSYGKKTLDKSHFSEDKRKNAHVTGTIGLNVIQEEKWRKIVRVNIVLKREGYFNENEYCSVLQCLEMGRFFLGSF